MNTQDNNSPKLTVEQYISERLDDQINWYDKKSSWNQKRYKRLRIITISLAVMIPFLTGLIDENSKDLLKILIGVSGAMVAIIEGFQSTYKFQENWIQYRTTTESLKHQKMLFLTQSGPYASDDSFSVLVENVEALISKENSDWRQNFKTKEHNKKND